MKPRRAGTEFLDDILLAKRIAQLEEERIVEQKKLEALGDEASLACAMYMNAQEIGRPKEEIARLKATNDMLQDKLAAAQKRFVESSLPPPSSSIDLIRIRLGMGSEAKTESKEMKGAVTLRTFTAHEMKQLNEHQRSLPSELKNLMNTAINDEIVAFELIANPVFIRGEGHIYDDVTVRDLLKAKGEFANCPMKVSQRFSKADIIPCNSLINAMTLLLGRLNGEEKTPAPVGKPLSTLSLSDVPVKVSADDINLLNEMYVLLPPQHKLLFDAICRDPHTNVIMSDPIMLPDGYIYDRKTAISCLNITDGECPANPSIKFTEADITPCYFVERVLKQLKKNMEGVLAARVASTSSKKETHPSVAVSMRK